MEREEVALIAKALSDANRIRIIEMLVDGEKCGCEILEELDTKIDVIKLIDTIEYDYPTFHLSMECYYSIIDRGNLVLKEHENSKWLNKAELKSVNWLPADLKLLDKLSSYL